jgi:hypothetical protein
MYRKKDEKTQEDNDLGEKDCQVAAMLRPATLSSKVRTYNARQSYRDETARVKLRDGCREIHYP